MAQDSSLSVLNQSGTNENAQKGVFMEGTNGAKREHFYPMFELLEPELLRRTAEVMTLGAQKYDIDQWKNFDTSQVLDIQRHAFQHIVDYMAGDESEDHLANAACNIMFLMYFESQGMKTRNKPETKSKYANFKTSK